MNTNDICDIELDGIDTKDYPDFCDAFICAANWKNGTALTEAELDELNDNYGDFVYYHIIEHLS